MSVKNRLSGFKDTVGSMKDSMIDTATNYLNAKQLRLLNETREELVQKQEELQVALDESEHLQKMISKMNEVSREHIKRLLEKSQ